MKFKEGDKVRITFELTDEINLNDEPGIIEGHAIGIYCVKVFKAGGNHDDFCYLSMRPAELGR